MKSFQKQVKESVEIFRFSQKMAFFDNLKNKYLKFNFFFNFKSFLVSNALYSDTIESESHVRAAHKQSS